MERIKDSSAFTDKSYIKFLYKCFYDIHNILVENNIFYIASGGSILGAIRHKGIIPWDDDIDLEISWKDIPALLSLKKVFKKHGYTINTEKREWIKIDSKKKVKGEIVSIDIFPIKIDTNGKRTRFYDESVNDSWPKAYHKISDIFPLKFVKFGKGKILIPNNSEPYLDRLYGKKWRTSGLIIQDWHHNQLNPPIKVDKKFFVPAKDFSSAQKQIVVKKNSPLRTGYFLNFLI